MKNYRTVILPLLLFCVILLSGFFSPILFDRLISDPRNKVEPITIEIVDSPMYLERIDTVILPPWDEINIEHANYLLDTFAVTDDQKAALSRHIETDIQALFPNTSTADTLQYTDITEALQIHGHNLLFLQDHSCSFRFDVSDESAPYTLDYVFDVWNTFPVYLHLQGEKTLPLADDREFRNHLEQVMSQLKRDFRRKGVDPIDSLKAMNTDKYAAPLTEAFMSLLSHDTTDKKVWLSILLNCQDIYTLTYKNETLVVMVDKENLISCLFFDALTNRVTGYGIDPQLVSLSMDPTRISP